MQHLHSQNEPDPLGHQWRPLATGGQEKQTICTNASAWIDTSSARKPGVHRGQEGSLKPLQPKAFPATVMSPWNPPPWRTESSNWNNSSAKSNIAKLPWNTRSSRSIATCTKLRHRNLEWKPKLLRCKASSISRACRLARRWRPSCLNRRKKSRPCFAKEADTSDSCIGPNLITGSLRNLADRQGQLAPCLHANIH